MTIRRHLVTDKGTQFTAQSFVRCLKRRKIRHRYGAVGRKGSIARMERVWLSLKKELVDFTFALMPLAWIRRRLNSYARWYNTSRPNGGVGLRMPDDVFRCRPPRRRRRLREGERLVLCAEYIGADRSLPNYFLRRAA